jgi:hypothetical protein
MKSDQSDFNYEPPPPPPRSSCRMGPYGPAYGPQPILTTTEGFPYRHNSIPSYPFQGKAYYGIPSYGDFPDETIDYSLQGAAYSLLSSESLGMPSNYSTSSNPRAGGCLQSSTAVVLQQWFSPSADNQPRVQSHVDEWNGKFSSPNHESADQQHRACATIPSASPIPSFKRRHASRSPAHAQPRQFTFIQ